jgi:IS5 family transposase
LQTGPPIDTSGLSRRRKRLAEAGMIRPASIKRVIVDTTVMAKANAPPTNSALLEKCGVLLV